MKPFTVNVSLLPCTCNKPASQIRRVSQMRKQRMEVILMVSDSSKLRVVRALRYAVLAIVCILLVQSKPSYGQVDEGAITGTVLDSSGAVVPNAEVTLLNTDQGITSKTKTNGSGGYTFSPVRLGHYTVTVTAPGFAKTTQNNLT